MKNKEILPTSPTFVIVEAGVNYEVDMNVAKKLIDLLLYKMDGKNSIDFKLASFYLKTFHV